MINAAIPTATVIARLGYFRSDRGTICALMMREDSIAPTIAATRIHALTLSARHALIAFSPRPLSSFDPSHHYDHSTHYRYDADCYFSSRLEPFCDSAPSWKISLPRMIRTAKRYKSRQDWMAAPPAARRPVRVRKSICTMRGRKRAADNHGYRERNAHSLLTLPTGEDNSQLPVSLPFPS